MIIGTRSFTIEPTPLSTVFHLRFKISVTFTQIFHRFRFDAVLGTSIKLDTFRFKSNRIITGISVLLNSATNGLLIDVHCFMPQWNHFIYVKTQTLPMKDCTAAYKPFFLLFSALWFYF